jgi:hypothetical protein
VWWGLLAMVLEGWCQWADQKYGQVVVVMRACDGGRQRRWWMYRMPSAGGDGQQVDSGGGGFSWVKGVVNTEVVRRRMEVRQEEADGGRKEVGEEQEGRPPGLSRIQAPFWDGMSISQL